jgi:hypothetical protein
MTPPAGLADAPHVAREQRAVVYYAALLIGMGCHTDAHEQAKWFGDDFAPKANKFEAWPAQPPRSRGHDEDPGVG